MMLINVTFSSLHFNGLYANGSGGDDDDDDDDDDNDNSIQFLFICVQT
jgi:hypothetical protein